MKNYKRLHVISIVSEFFKGLRRILIPAILAYFIGENADPLWLNVEYKNLIAIAGLLAALIFGLYRWVTFKYKIDHNEIYIRKGFFIKNDFYISSDKVKTIEVSRKIVPRIFGLVQLSIKVEGIEDNDPTITLVAISKSEAETIRSSLVVSSVNNLENENVKEIQVYSPPVKELLLFAVTSNNLIPSMVTVSAVLYQFNEQLGIPSIETILSSEFIIIFKWLSIVFTLGLVFSITRTMVQFNNFNVFTDSGKVVIQKGALNKKELIISIEDVKAIRIEENVLRQLFGFACIYVESSSGESEKRSVSTILYPLIKVGDINEFLMRLSLPSPNLISAAPLTNKAKYRFIIKYTLLGIAVSVFFWLGFSEYKVLPILIIAIFTWWGYLIFKDTAYGVNHHFFYLKRRFINKSTVIITRKHIETMLFKQSFAQRSAGLQTLKLVILSNISKKKYSLVNYPEENQIKFHNWYRNKSSCEEIEGKKNLPYS
jgi:putative membrane protein